ncbi:MAG TPA: outer membrane lipoprotein-sorting protein [Chthoniobacterales bacterium]|nr:outer membrane lipoprotein-sorting protein [Chthoniobacterales bacterium]
MKQVKKLIALVALVLALLPLAGSAQEPDAAAILDGVRLAAVNRELNGQLRKEDGTTIPFRLILSGSQVIYRFNNPDETLRVELKDSTSTLKQDEGGKTHLIAGSQLTERVRGTDLSYEDLSLHFLYWANPKVEGEKTVKGFSCWIILVQHVGRDSNYTSVRMWVTKDGNGLLRAEAFNSKGKLVKRFEVISGQKVEDKWIPKQVRVQVYNPDTGKQESRTYLEING